MDLGLDFEGWSKKGQLEIFFVFSAFGFSAGFGTAKKKLFCFCDYFIKTHSEYVIKA